MKIGTQTKKLHRRIKNEKKYKEGSYNNLEVEDVPIEMNSKDSNKMDLLEHLDFLKKIQKMIEDGASGFDLAYEVEKNHEIKNLLYDGILFYNVFLEIGQNKFINMPDKRKIDYKSFRTIEDTEKYIFMEWLKDTINTLEKDIRPKEDYTKYLEKLKEKELKESREKLRESLKFCKNCGERIRSKDQEFCEKCGINLMESILE